MLAMEDVLAVRLYSGPAYQPINDFLRQIANLTGNFRTKVAHDPGLTFAATVAHLCAAIRKLAAVATPGEARARVWRGVRGELPKHFFEADEKGLVVAVDMAFMSTSLHRQTPIHYMHKRQPNVLWELLPQEESDAGFHCGANISLLSQFAAEGECLFPPYTMLQVLQSEEMIEIDELDVGHGRGGGGGSAELPLPSSDDATAAGGKGGEAAGGAGASASDDGDGGRGSGGGGASPISPASLVPPLLLVNSDSPTATPLARRPSREAWYRAIDQATMHVPKPEPCYRAPGSSRSASRDSIRQRTESAIKDAEGSTPESSPSKEPEPSGKRLSAPVSDLASAAAGALRKLSLSSRVVAVAAGRAEWGEADEGERQPSAAGLHAKIEPRWETVGEKRFLKVTAIPVFH